MGLFSRFFREKSKKPVARIRIGYYDINRAFVQFEQLGPTDDPGIDQWNMACAYYAETLHQLARSPQAPQLYDYVGQIVEKSIDDSSIHRLNLLAEGQELLPSGLGAENMVHEVTLHEMNEGRVVESNIPNGGTEFYTPTSMVLILEYLVRTMTDDHLALLMMALKAMNSYYRDIRPFTDPQARLEAPAHAMALAVEYVKQIQGEEIAL